MISNVQMFQILNNLMIDAYFISNKGIDCGLG